MTLFFYLQPRRVAVVLIKDMTDLIGKQIADKYRVESLIREGSDGDLYKGLHETTDTPVILKVLPQAVSIDARWSRRFVEEARAASTVSHPNVLRVTDFGSDARGTTYAVYNDSETTTLRDLMTGEPMGQSRALGIARQIAAGLAAAHERNVVHASLNPTNVFVSTGEDGADAVKVYGLGADPMSVARDADPRYLAPEQCNAYPAADARSDVFSLGVILFEMLSGTVPYDGKTPADVLAKMHDEPPAPLSAFQRDLHSELEPIILTALAIDPEKRYQSVAAFAEDLDMVAGSSAATAPKRNAWQTAAVAGIAILILGGALIWATWTRRTDPTAQLVADPGSLPVQPIGPATGAQEESLARLPEMTEAEIMAAANSNMIAPNAGDMLPGGDGYNPWAGGGAPPVGAPPQQYIPPGGQMIDPSTGGSQFMPPDAGGTVLYTMDGAGRCFRVPDMQPMTCPPGAPGTKPQPTPRTPANTNANTSAPANTAPAATPRPLATPPANRPPASNTRPAANRTPTQDESGKDTI